MLHKKLKFYLKVNINFITNKFYNYNNYYLIFDIFMNMMKLRLQNNSQKYGKLKDYMYINSEFIDRAIVSR
jgi:hypothetical protein